MSNNFDPSYQRPAKAQKGEAVEDFELETYHSLENAEPLPDPSEDFSSNKQETLEPFPDPFAEFQVERTPLSALATEVPSLDNLFKPFDLEAENPEQGASYEDLYDFVTPRDYTYEDLDTRDPGVVRTLAQAEEKRLEIIKEAQVESARWQEEAAAERAALPSELAAKRQDALAAVKDEIELLREEAQNLRAEAEQIKAKAESERTQAENERQKALTERAELEGEGEIIQESFAALSHARGRLEDEFNTKKQELEAEIINERAILAEKSQTAEAEAQERGYREGHEKGLSEGRATGHNEAQSAFQQKIEPLLHSLEQVEALYQDLWAANGPMMIKLAIEAAEQILHKELNDANDLATKAFEACIDFLSQAHRVVFTVRSQDLAQLEEARADQRERLGALLKVSFKTDDTLGPGDLIMESDIGRLDATVKHRTNQVLSVLRQAFESQHGDLGASPPPLNTEAETATETTIKTGAESNIEPNIEPNITSDPTPETVPEILPNPASVAEEASTAPAPPNDEPTKKISAKETTKLPRLTALEADDVNPGTNAVPPETLAEENPSDLPTDTDFTTTSTTGSALNTVKSDE